MQALQAITRCVYIWYSDEMFKKNKEVAGDDDQPRKILRRVSQRENSGANNDCYSWSEKSDRPPKTQEHLSNIWTSFSDDYKTFCRRYEEDLACYGKIEKFTAKPDVPENNFNVSMVPWITFEGININISDCKYLLPISTISH